jgi:hypothetical protein
MFEISDMPNSVPDHFNGTEEPNARVLSLGAGVQSTVLALMADKGLFDSKPDIAIFADTGWEPESVYKHLSWLEDELKTIKVLRVKVRATKKKRPRDNRGRFIKTSLREHLMNGVNSSGNRFITVPLYMKNKDGKPAIGRRQCTREYKITPIIKSIRRDVLKLKPKQRLPKGHWVEQWLGISTDEITRMKDNRENWVVNRWPLIEAANLSRAGCEDWFSENYRGRMLPRSACIGCPLRTINEWMEMKENDPESWNEAVKFDEALRVGSRVEKFGAEMYISTKRIPLRELKKSMEPKQKKQKGSLLQECEGMCGL